MLYNTFSNQAAASCIVVFVSICLTVISVKNSVTTYPVQTLNRQTSTLTKLTFLIFFLNCKPLVFPCSFFTLHTLCFRNILTTAELVKLVESMGVTGHVSFTKKIYWSQDKYLKFQICSSLNISNSFWTQGHGSFIISSFLMKPFTTVTWLILYIPTFFYWHLLYIVSRQNQGGPIFQ